MEKLGVWKRLERGEIEVMWDRSIGNKSIEVENKTRQEKLE